MLEKKRNYQGVSLATRKRVARNSPSGKVRIVGGRFKRTPVAVVDAPGLRPTADRVRETLFNWLASLTGGWDSKAALDMFAGTGVLGLEAASRGAERVLSFEKHPVAARALRALAQKLDANLEVRQGDALALITKTDELFDVIFIDPPFASELMGPALEAALTRLKKGGMIYLEASVDTDLAFLSDIGLTPVRSDRAGAVRFGLFMEKTHE
ncbi:MAG TPA: 16S rRNA (guanine(966)-N(2))-methyltransferase RsmD [Sutterella sp.]|nr:16S rRNA (guanine(966)-N(2))-methyltransferase RsmD [Sutterella sp.]